MTSTDELIAKMEKFKKDFYDNEGKNSFFKKTQKIECAKKMSNTFQLNEMIQKTIYVIPSTDKIIFDYTIFKLYACPENYDIIINYVIKIYDFILLQFPAFEVNIILDSFTISAAERYKVIINDFCNKCMNAQTKYSELISKIKIFYTPSMIESITSVLKPFIDKDVLNKMSFVSKAESPQVFKELFTAHMQR